MEYRLMELLVVRRPSNFCARMRFCWNIKSQQYAKRSRHNYSDDCICSGPLANRNAGDRDDGSRFRSRLSIVSIG